MAIWRTYYTHHPLWVEHAANGIAANVGFFELLTREGYWFTWTNSLATRGSLQPAVLGLVWPRLLWWPSSHILVTALALCLFLILLVRFVRLRTGSDLLGLGTAVLFCTLGGLYNERNGMGVPWPDYQSMFFLSSAALSLGIYSLSARVGWLALAGGCVSLATLARDTGAAYSVVICLPLFALLLAREFSNGGGVRSVVKFGLWCGIPALPGIVLLLNKIQFLRSYYMTSNAHQLRHPFGEALRSIWDLSSAFSGIPVIVGMGLLLAGGLFAWPRRKWSVQDIVVAYWPLSFFAFLLANGYTGDMTKEVMYMAPGFVCAAATLGGGMDVRSRPARALLYSVLGVCLVGAGVSAMTAYTRARNPPAGASALRSDQARMAEALASVPQRVVWSSFSSYDWGTVLSALTIYENGRYQPNNNSLFHNRKSYWDAAFPGMDLPTLQERVLAQAEAQADLAIVLKDPNQKPAGMEDYSFSIASYVAEHVRDSSGWRHIRDVDTSTAGPLAFYLNVRRMRPGSVP